MGTDGRWGRGGGKVTGELGTRDRQGQRADGLANLNHLHVECVVDDARGNLGRTRRQWALGRSFVAGARASMGPARAAHSGGEWRSVCCLSVSASEKNPTVTGGVWRCMWGGLEAKAYGYALP
eukprot:scaffold6562_cov120-Isochrysis_galbana.AAC.10